MAADVYQCLRLVCKKLAYQEQYGDTSDKMCGIEY